MKKIDMHSHIGFVEFEKALAQGDSQHESARVVIDVTAESVLEKMDRLNIEHQLLCPGPFFSESNRGDDAFNIYGSIRVSQSV